MFKCYCRNFFIVFFELNVTRAESCIKFILIVGQYEAPRLKKKN